MRKVKSAAMRADNNKQGWKSPKSEEDLTAEERSFDIGESGQFGPGGYYDQQGVDAPQPTDLDEDVVPPVKGSRIPRKL